MEGRRNGVLLVAAGTSCVPVTGYLRAFSTHSCYKVTAGCRGAGLLRPAGTDLWSSLFMAPLVGSARFVRGDLEISVISVHNLPGTQHGSVLLQGHWGFRTLVNQRPRPALSSTQRGAVVSVLSPHVPARPVLVFLPSSCSSANLSPLSTVGTGEGEELGLNGVG